MINILEEVEKVYQLYERGLISEEEFTRQKDRLFEQQIKDVSDTPMVRPWPAFKSFWKNAFRWKGRSTRAEMIWPGLINAVIASILLFLTGYLQSYLFYFLYLGYGILVFIPGLGVTVRRFHDIGYSTKIALLPFILILMGGLMAVVFQIVDYVNQGQALAPWLLTLRSLIFIISGFLMIGASMFWIICLFFPTQMKTNRWGDPR